MNKPKNKNSFFEMNYALLPVAFVLFIVPLIVRIYIYNPGLQKYAWFSDNEQEADIFLYWKGIALITAATVMLGIFLFHIWGEWKSGTLKQTFLQSKWVVFLAVFGLLTLFSTIFSEYRTFGFNGIYEQFESVWVVLSYCMAMLYTFYFVRKKSDIDVIEKSLFILLIILSILGITQLLGHDFWETDIGKRLFIPEKYAELRDTLTFNFSGSGTHQVYMTFYNPNYVGVFAVLILPITTMLCAGNKDRKKKFAWGILSVTIFLCALGSGSKAFLISLLAVAVLGVIICGKKVVKHLPIVLLVLAITAGCTLGYMKYANINLFAYVKTAVTPVKNNYPVNDFIIEKEYVKLIYKDEPLFMTCNASADGQVIFLAWDKAENIVPFSIDENAEGILHFNDERFSDITINLYGGMEEYSYIAEVNVDNKKFAFSSTEDGYIYVNPMYTADKLKKAEAAIFTDYDSLFSGRGYIWSRTIPLLKEHILLGTGADSYTLLFPQDDYIARINAGYEGSIITKPHSIYLQMGVQYGVLAVICYLALAVCYVVPAIKLCWNSKYETVYSYMALGILLGIVGYGIAGISNDSSVSLAPIAWVLLGVGFALNKIMKKEENL